jgi:hypothetical protein
MLVPRSCLRRKEYQAGLDLHRSSSQLTRLECPPALSILDASALLGACVNHMDAPNAARSIDNNADPIGHKHGADRDRLDSPQRILRAAYSSMQRGKLAEDFAWADSRSMLSARFSSDLLAWAARLKLTT